MPIISYSEIRTQPTSGAHGLSSYTPTHNITIGLTNATTDHLVNDWSPVISATATLGALIHVVVLIAMSRIRTERSKELHTMFMNFLAVDTVICLSSFSISLYRPTTLDMSVVFIAIYTTTPLISMLSSVMMIGHRCVYLIENQWYHPPRRRSRRLLILLITICWTVPPIIMIPMCSQFILYKNEAILSYKILFAVCICASILIIFGGILPALSLNASRPHLRALIPEYELHTLSVPRLLLKWIMKELNMLFVLCITVRTTVFSWISLYLYICYLTYTNWGMDTEFSFQQAHILTMLYTVALVGITCQKVILVMLLPRLRMKMYSMFACTKRVGPLNSLDVLDPNSRYAVNDSGRSRQNTGNFHDIFQVTQV